MKAYNQCLVQSRVKYGRSLIYPINTTAKLLALLTGRKTFTLKEMQTIDRLGFEVEYIPPSIDIDESQDEIDDWNAGIGEK